MYCDKPLLPNAQSRRRWPLPVHDPTVRPRKKSAQASAPSRCCRRFDRLITARWYGHVAIMSLYNSAQPMIARIWHG